MINVQELFFFQKCATGESAWEWNEEKGMYYFHNFLRHMPDINLATSGEAKKKIKVKPSNTTELQGSFG